uniref:Uncharacterized protein n=1 Tax=Clytia hemisphaerica TaxID=252671 RepID=A0A7M5XBN9_9CNID
MSDISLHGDNENDEYIESAQRSPARESNEDPDVLLTFQAFLVYRRDNPGSKSKNAYLYWKKNGGEDHPGYAEKWKAKQKRRMKKRINKHKMKKDCTSGAKHYHIRVERG